MIILENITLSVAREVSRQQWRFQRLQTVVTLMHRDGMYHNWKPIIGYYIFTKKICLDYQMYEFKGYFNYIAFDFVPGHNLMSVVKISQKAKTTNFRDLTSIN